ncbi:zinc finger MYM-type protein 1-like [Homarus americanus]|uniref:zinc finger MYM-type protein 1-like n=1 Tax=Homarus americanus TaxID=6706 RepID=UPI001C471BC2|nr:zinc finger MYM-type protein 1-like [Homarus americanus]
MPCGEKLVVRDTCRSGVQEEVPRQEFAVQEEIARPELPKCEIQQCRSSDPAEWEVNVDILNYYADHIPSQNLDAGFSKRGRQFGDKKRLQHQKHTRIEAELEKVKQEAYRYWFKVLKRIVAVVRFLSERGLAFRGDNEVVGSPNNGNFLGCLELLAEFDPFLHDHVEKLKNPGKGHVSYLSSTVCEEFIGLMKMKVKEHIITEIKDSKYYGVSIDSTPDISHTDELAVILRYVLSDGMVVERFVQFIPIERHDGKYLFDTLTNFFQQNGIDIAWCRSQCYDNASNMIGIYSGVQSRFKEVNNLAEWVPCAAHSLNLVGSVAVENCTAAVNFFGVVQCIYNFFSASPQRWSILTESLKNPINAYAVHSMSETRWSARSDAVSALFLNYSEIRQSLINVAEFTGQPPSAAHEAKSLVKKLDAFETALICIIWNDLLKKINIVNKAIQEPGIELGTVVKMYDSLLAYFSEIRDKFESFEETAKEFSKSDYKEEMQGERKRMRKQFFGEGARDDTVSTMTASDRFRTQTFYPIVDKLIVQMGRRQEAYSVLCDRFGFLVDKSLSQDKVILKARNLVKTYSSDLEECFADEFLLFSNMYPEEKTVNGMLWINNQFS